MKILADESVDYAIVKALRKKRFDVVFVAESSAGMTDEKVLEFAKKSGRVLLTADKDFGELVFRHKRINNGVILYRFCGMTNENKVRLVSDLFLKYLDKFENNFTVIKWRV